MIQREVLSLLRRKHFLGCSFLNKKRYPNRIKPLSYYFTPVRWNHSDEPPIDLTNFPIEDIRNFSIIAHVDHGKSTLADRIMEVTGAIKSDAANKQVLDTLQVERERGITVKAQSVSMVYKHKGKNYLLNLIDTPGHVDFSYEVSRALAACQGVILLVDANQGIQAQTVANFYLAFTKELYILPVLNKIDLKGAEPQLVKEQLKNVFEIEPSDVLSVSAKTGIGIDELLGAIIERIPSPAAIGKPDGNLRALLYDSWYDLHKGVKCLVVVVDGSLKVGDTVSSFHTKKSYNVRTIVMNTPNETPVDKLSCGQVGVFTAMIKKPKEAMVGDTFHKKDVVVTPLEGFQVVKPMVYAGVYAMDQADQRSLKAALEKLVLNDASVTLTQESSPALGLGWRIGFLGLLHMEVFNTRLEQEYSAEVVITTPSVPYQIKYRDTKERRTKKESMEEIIINPQYWPDVQAIEETLEPMVRATIITPEDGMSIVVGCCQARRGTQIDLRYLEGKRVILTYKMPLNEVIVDFFDELKSISSGYATFDYEDAGYEAAHLNKLTFQLNQKPLDELCMIVHHSRVRDVAKHISLRLLELVPRQQFAIAIQGVVNNTVVARENIKALKKDVTAKLYGGDRTRKMKLLKRQADGKKKMKLVGNIEVPRDVFISVLKK